MLIAQSTGAGTADWLLEPKNQTASHYFLAIEKGAKYKKKRILDTNLTKQMRATRNDPLKICIFHLHFNKNIITLRRRFLSKTLYTIQILT